MNDYRRSRAEQVLETQVEQEKEQRRQAGVRPWQFIPKSMLAEAEHRAKVKAWGDAQHEQLITEWSQRQRRTVLDEIGDWWQRMHQPIEQKAEVPTGWASGYRPVPEPREKPTQEQLKETLDRLAEQQAQGVSNIGETFQRQAIEPGAAILMGPTLQSNSQMGPLPFIRRASEVGIPQAWQEQGEQWRQAPEPLPGVKGVLEMANPLAAIAPSRAEQPLAQLAEKAKALAPAARVENVAEKVMAQVEPTAGLPGPPSKAPAATGTMPPEPGDFAANIRLEKYPEEVRDTLQAWVNAHPEEVDAARRGVQSDADVMTAARQLVEETGGNFDKLVRGWKPGQAWSAEEVAALRGTLRSKAEEVLAAQKAIQVGGDTSENLLRLRLAIEEHSAIQKVAHGVTAEAGRALRQFRQPVSEALQSGDQQQIERALKTLGGREPNEQIARAFASLDTSNPDAVYTFIRGITKPKLNDYIVELFYNSILSGPKTHIVNTVSNALTAIGSPVERVAAAAVDVPLAALQGRPRGRYVGEAKADLFGMLRGIPEGVRAATYVFKHGFTAEQATKWEFRPRAFGGATGRIINLPSTALEASDQLFRAINYRAALNAEAYRLGKGNADKIADLLADPTPELMERAGKMAEYRLFRQEPGTFTRGVMKLRDADILGVQPLRFVIPFLRTPVNLLKFGLERSPLGFLNPKLWEHLAKKSPEASDEIARAALGSGLAAAVAWYAADGKITGAAPSNKLDRERFYREGKQPYSIKIGDQWVSYQRLEPFNQALSQVAAAVDAMHTDDKDATEQVSQAVLTIGKNLVSQTYLSGLSDVLDALAEPERYGSNFLQRTVASIATPFSSALRTGAQIGDTTIRQPKGLAESIMAGLPGLSQNVPARLDAFGEDVKRESPAWLPISVTTEKDTALNRELSRLDIDVGFVGDSIRGMPLNRAEQAEYQRAVGKSRKQLLEQLVSHDAYQRADDATRAKLMEAAIVKARNDIADLYLQYIVSTKSRDELNRRLTKGRAE